MRTRSGIEVEATFLRYEDGGRVQMPDLTAGRYAPDVVLQSPEVRRAVVQGNVLLEPYLPVSFVAGPSPILAGESGRFAVELRTSQPESFTTGTTFTIREGPRIVGYGTVMSGSEFEG